MYDVTVYTTESGRSPLEKYLKDLTSANKQADLTRIYASIKRLQDYGLEVNNIYPHTIRNLRGDIYELRPDNHRILFFYFSGKEFVLLHAFKKQHQKAPPHEIDRAEKEMNDFKRRNTNG